MRALWLCLTTGLFMFNLVSQPLGVFDAATDVGNPKLKGNTVYDANQQKYTISGAGYNIWFNRDEFHYAHKKLKGDFILTADFSMTSSGSDPHRKYGWMVRESLQEDAAHMTAAYHVGDGLTAMQWRVLRGAYMRDPEDEIFFNKRKVRTIQLERRGATYFMRVANWGEPLQVVGSHTMDNLKGEVFAGIFIGSHHPEVVEETVVWNVRIDYPVRPGFNFYSADTLISRLEIMSPFDGQRKVIHSGTTPFEAPNWMPDGRQLLFNQKGSLYTISTSGGPLTKHNTGFADRLNNDHVISFDGKLLGISHSRSGKRGGGSTVYVLPLAGGTPKLITEETPSYLHGWSADNRDVVYVAYRDTVSRNPLYHLYKKNINGGPEIKLTDHTFGHVDGPEYSPDGQWIYYNGSQSGTMQLWRMKPDGSGKEQLTFDAYNNWFPHISPDGKWIVYIAFEPDINPGDHPPCKPVSLRLMPAGGGAPRVIAHLYGGQGTINVPSWSPDSKHIAFVSYGGK